MLTADRGEVMRQEADGSDHRREDNYSAQKISPSEVGMVCYDSYSLTPSLSSCKAETSDTRLRQSLFHLRGLSP